jgi:hypothetical protein
MGQAMMDQLELFLKLILMEVSIIPGFTPLAIINLVPGLVLKHSNSAPFPLDKKNDL